MTDEKTTTAEALLGMLSLRPRSGYELKQAIGFSIGNFWNESFGQIYPALKKLEADGFVSSAAEGKAGRVVYSLTEAGRERLQGWLGLPVRPRVKRQESLLKLFFGVEAEPGAMEAQIAEMRERALADLQRYDAQERMLQATYFNMPGLPYWLMTLRYGRAEARMIVSWCDETLAALATLDADARRAEQGRNEAWGEAEIARFNRLNEDARVGKGRQGDA